MSIGHHTRRFSRDRAQPVAFLRKKGWASLQAAAELCGRHANHTPEDLSKMARARVADFERDLDQAPRGFADELLCARSTAGEKGFQRTIRSRVTNCRGDVPVACLNTREKWKGLSSTSSANASTEMLSATCART